MAQKRLMLGPVGRVAVELLVKAADEQQVVRARVAAEVGISEATLSRTFKFERALTVDEFNDIAAVLGLVGWRVLREAQEIVDGDNVIEFPFNTMAAKRDKEGPLDGQGADPYA